ncbi:MAG: hypothetical protein QXT92_00105 [Nitrososphaerota archaeon]
MPWKIKDTIPFRYNNCFLDIHEVGGVRKLYFGQWYVIETHDGSEKIAYVAIFDDGTAVAEKDEIKRVGLKIRKVPVRKPPPRWPPWSARNFLEGNFGNPSEMEVYEECLEAFRDYIDFGEEWGAPMLLSLYTIQTYLTPVFQAVAYIGITGHKRTGKSKILDVAEQLCFNALKPVNLTGAALFRNVDIRRATVLFDEADFKDPDRKRDILMMLRAGYRRGEYVVREREVRKKGKKDFEEEYFDVFGPKVFVIPEGIEEMLRDRCIMINMQRTTNEAITKKRVDPRDDRWDVIRSLLYVFALRHWREVEENYMNMDLEGISAREYEKWSPLFAIAKIFGVEEELYKYAMKKIRETYLEEETESPTIKTLRTCFALLIDHKRDRPGFEPYYSAAEISDKAVSIYGKEKWTKPGTIGRIMTNILGFCDERLKTVEGGRTKYLLDEEKLRTLAKRYNIDPDNPLGAS